MPGLEDVLGRSETYLRRRMAGDCFECLDRFNRVRYRSYLIFLLAQKRMRVDFFDMDATVDSQRFNDGSATSVSQRCNVYGSH